MKKKILFLIILLLIPTLVLAKDTCNDNDINIKSIALKELNGFSEEIQESSINNNTINLNLKMYDVGDSSTYNITVENTSNEDYYFTKDSMKLENDYLEYSLKNDSELIPTKEEKTIELKVSYKNKIPNDSYSDTSKLTISLSDKPLENPKTNISHNYLILIILLIVITTYVEVRNKSLSKNKLLLMISVLSTIPISINALCTVNLNVETKIEIENKKAVFLPGQEAIVKIKELAGDDTSTSTKGYNFKDENVIAIKHSESEPSDSNKEEKNIVSTADSPYPIYMWYIDGTIYWWSEDKHPSLNEDASYMFYYLHNLNDISGLEDFDASNTKKLKYIFSYDSITNLDALKQWNTKNLEEMYSMFSWDMQLTNIDGIKNWDTSKVTTMVGLFHNTHKLLSVDAVKNWDVSNVEDMESMFSCSYSLEEIDLSNWHTDKLKNMNNMFASLYYSQDYSLKSNLKRIKLSENFDTSKVTSMSCLLYNDQYIEDYSFLKYFDSSSLLYISQMFQDNVNFNSLSYLKDWDVSKVKNFYLVFAGCTSLTNLEGLENWDVSNAEIMERMFDETSALNDISAIKDWNVSKVTNYNFMFAYNSSLQDASPINEWNISKTATFRYMFYDTPSHPEFIKVPGTWNSSGTFTPTP